MDKPTLTPETSRPRPPLVSTIADLRTHYSKRFMRCMRQGFWGDWQQDEGAAMDAPDDHPMGGHYAFLTKDHNGQDYAIRSGWVSARVHASLHVVTVDHQGERWRVTLWAREGHQHPEAADIRRDRKGSRKLTGLRNAALRSAIAWAALMHAGY